jgi:uncharacterized membrane protein
MSVNTLLAKGAAIDRRLGVALLAPSIIILGSVLRFTAIGVESYWLDEIKMLEVANRDINTLLSQIFGGRPPVFVLMAHFWMQWFGTAEGVTRILSAIFGSLALIFMYRVGRELLGQKIALIATFLMAVSEIQIQQSQNFRYYAVFMFFALISFDCFVRALRTGRARYWILYTLTTVLTFYSHTHGIFLIAAQGLYFVVLFRKYRPAWLPWLASQVVIFVALLPGMLTAFLGASSGESNVFQWIRDPKLWTPLITLVKFVLPGRHAPTLPTLIVAGLFGLLGLGVYIGLRHRHAWLDSMRGVWRSFRSEMPEPSILFLLACWLVVPIASPLLLSKVFGPMYVDRYVIGAAPALYLLIALVIVSLRKVVPEVVTVGALVILITPGLYEYYTVPTNEQWREAAAYIRSNIQANDHFVFAPGEEGAMQESLAWYYHSPMPGCGIEAAVRDAPSIAQQITNCLAGADRFWLIVRGYPERVQPYVDFFVTHTPSSMQLQAVKRLKDVDLYLFGYAR